MKKFELTVYDVVVWVHEASFESLAEAEAALAAEVAKNPKWPAFVTESGKLVRFWWPLKVLSA